MPTPRVYNYNFFVIKDDHQWPTNYTGDTFWDNTKVYLKKQNTKILLRVNILINIKYKKLNKYI